MGTCLAHCRMEQRIYMVWLITGIVMAFRCHLYLAWRMDEWALVTATDIAVLPTYPSPRCFIISYLSFSYVPTFLLLAKR